jgi:8-oxo-dGTP pyrophosphatase MutT (NUDIX family)
MWMDALRRSLRETPGTHVGHLESYAGAAVAVLIRPDGDVLFIQRAVYEGDPWSGHMALPGGRIDPEDENAEAAARREVLEEVGVDVSTAILLGELDQVASPDLAPRVCVTPYVFALTDDPVVAMDSREVAAIHWFGLDRFVQGEGRGQFPYTYQGTDYQLPCIDLDGRRIWGMTLRIVEDLLARLQTTS